MKIRWQKWNQGKLAVSRAETKSFLKLTPLFSFIHPSFYCVKRTSLFGPQSVRWTIEGGGDPHSFGEQHACGPEQRSTVITDGWRRTVTDGWAAALESNTSGWRSEHEPAAPRNVFQKEWQEMQVKCRMQQTCQNVEITECGVHFETNLFQWRYRDVVWDCVIPPPAGHWLSTTKTGKTIDSEI